MQTKQTITIIGNTLNIGSFVAKSLSKGNSRLLLCTGEPQMVETLLHEIKSVSPHADAEAAGCQFDASWESDIIMVAVPIEGLEETAERIRAVANQKIVISLESTGNSILNVSSTAEGEVATETLQKLLPNSKIVRVSISAFEGEISFKGNAPAQINAVISGESKAALETVADLFRTAELSVILKESFSLNTDS